MNKIHSVESCFSVVFLLPRQVTWPQFPPVLGALSMLDALHSNPQSLISCFSLFLLILADVVN